MMKTALRAALATIVLLVITAVIYPLVITGVAQVALKDKAKVHVTIEAKAEEIPAAKHDDDPTGWKAADELIGFIKDAPPDMAEKHDEYLYKRHTR